MTILAELCSYAPTTLSTLSCSAMTVLASWAAFSHRRCAVVVQLVSVPRPIVQQMPKLLQSLLGYHRFGIGVDGRDPVDVLENGDEIETYWSPDARLADEQPAYADRSRL